METGSRSNSEDMACAPNNLNLMQTIQFFALLHQFLFSLLNSLSIQISAHPAIYQQAIIPNASN